MSGISQCALEREGNESANSFVCIGRQIFQIESKADYEGVPCHFLLLRMCVVIQLSFQKNPNERTFTKPASHFTSNAFAQILHIYGICGVQLNPISVN